MMAMPPQVKNFENSLSSLKRHALRALSTPEKIQQFLDGIRYREEDTYHCPLKTLKTGKGCCFEGALLAAVALWRLGHPPSIVTLIAEDDDDHVLAIYKKGKCFGAVAKSVYPGLRSRQPVYRTLRELVMSYFEFYFNRRGKHTLREYSTPLDLKRFDAQNWLEKDDTIALVSDALDRTRHLKLVPGKLAKILPRVDAWTFAAVSPRRHK
jgi:hypothetical protein